MLAFPALSARGGAAAARSVGAGARGGAFAAGAAPPLPRCLAARRAAGRRRSSSTAAGSKAAAGGKTELAQRELVFDAAPSPAPGASLARQLYTQDCESAVNAQINVEVRDVACGV
jgi:hypothetical protein